MKNKLLIKHQRKIFLLCFFAYAIAYMGRVNLSVALPMIEKTYQYSKENLGIIGAAFFWMYAIGQIINGNLGDKFKSRYFAFIGLLFSRIINLIFGFATTLFFLFVLWALN